MLIHLLSTLTSECGLAWTPASGPLGRCEGELIATARQKWAGQWSDGREFGHGQGEGIQVEGTGDGRGRVQLVQSSGGISQQLESGVYGRWEGVDCDELLVFGKASGWGEQRTHTLQAPSLDRETVKP